MVCFRETPCIYLQIQRLRVVFGLKVSRWVGGWFMMLVIHTHILTHTVALSETNIYITYLFLYRYT